ncbi:F-box protein [Phanerochaete sordida]|uniref:F-box protein n=1 Tax=Phanerochaete sordida TaxID=48140 RepID=A0A9P3GI52_9APHY|nr:F-box protein [Phanerochaete sordida]
MSVARLPVELLQSIFSELVVLPPFVGTFDADDLSEGKQALGAASLVCRKWRDVAQAVLFQDVSVILQNEHAEDLPEKTWTKFAAFVRSSTHLSQQIRTLKIDHTPIQYGKDKQQSELLQRILVLDVHALMTLLVTLGRLKTLTLDSVDLFLPPRYSVLDLAPLQCKVENYTFLAHEKESHFALDDFAVFLVPFTNIRCLTLKYIQFSLGPHPALSFFPRFPHLEKLKLRYNNNVEMFLDLLQDAVIQGLLPSLRKLEVGAVGRDDLLPLNKLLVCMSDRLRSLAVQLDFKEMFGADNVLQLFRLAHLEELTFVLECPPYASSQPLWDPVLAALSALSAAPSAPPLQHIIFEYLEGHAIHDPEARNVHLPIPLQTGAFDALFARLPHLCTVAFRPPLGEEFDRFGSKDAAHIRQVCPQLHEKGMLVV